MCSQFPNLLCFSEKLEMNRSLNSVLLAKTCNSASTSGLIHWKTEWANKCSL